MAIIGICGQIGSGKDTVAQYLVAEHGFKQASFAGILKDVISVMFGWERSLLTGDTSVSREFREQVDTWWATRLNLPHLTPRWVMQHVGTNVLRNQFHPDIWLACLENKIRRMEQCNIVLSDCRFLNEIEAITRQRGKICSVVRGANPIWYDTASAQNARLWEHGVVVDDIMSREYPDVAISEYSVAGYKFDSVITNNGTIPQLHEQVNCFLNA